MFYFITSRLICTGCRFTTYTGFVMDMNLRLPFCEHGKEDEEPNGFDNLLDGDIKMHNGEEENGHFEDIGDESHVEENSDIKLPVATLVDFQEDSNLEPLSGMEFESHGEAYSFYQEYARSMGFNTAIQNSRRSKTSREFIDAKFACSRYGTKREYEKPVNRPRARQVKQEPQDTTGRRSCAKTDCKASMHVKRRSDGKWVIHKFVKDHNHELLPAQAVSEQTRKMYAAMARQFAEYKNLSGLKNDSRSPFDKRSSPVEAGDIKLLLEFCVQMQNMNSNFFYAVDLGDDQRVKNCLWVDAKSRHDYVHFSDVVSFDTTYVRNKYKMPLALFVGVNQHYQFLLLGCALISDESATTFNWLMRTWLRAMGGQAPKTIISEQDRALSSAIAEVFPNAFHGFCLWNVLGKVSENLGHVIKRHEKFMSKFEKCIFRSWTEEEFVNRWRKIVDRFELREDEWFQLLYEDCKHWVPTYMIDTFLAGMSTVQRSDSVNSFFDKYLHKKTTVPEFLKQYEAILQDRYEEEAKADSDTWNKHPSFKSPSPLEKHTSGIYTHAVFKKFQAEVLGAIACLPKEERTFDTATEFKVQDVEKNQEFTVTWNESKSEISCICRLFEYKGYLCRHAMIVLQMRGLSHVPSQYILKRWTRDAKSRQALGDGSDRVKSRVQRYVDICQRAVRLSEEASLSQESYDIAFRAVDEALGNCVTVNNSSKNLVEAAGTSASHGLIGFEEDNESRSMSKTSKKKNPTKRKKLTPDQDVMTVGVHENLQHMEKLNSRTVTLDPYYGTQPNMQMVQLNLMGPTRDTYYTNQQSIQGLGQLNSVAPTHDGYYGSQQSMHGLQGQMDFFRTPSFPYNLRDESNVRSGQLHEDASRHQ